MPTLALSTYYRKHCSPRVHSCLHPVYWRLRAGWSGDGYPGQRIRFIRANICQFRRSTALRRPSMSLYSLPVGGASLSLVKLHVLCKDSNMHTHYAYMFCNIISISILASSFYGSER